MKHRTCFTEKSSEHIRRANKVETDPCNRYSGGCHQSNCVQARCFFWKTVPFRLSSHFYHHHIYITATQPELTVQCILAWARFFLKITSSLRSDGKFMAIFLDGYGGTSNSMCRIKSLKIVLFLLKCPHIPCTGYNLWMCVFLTFKSMLQEELHIVSHLNCDFHFYGDSDCTSKYYTGSVSYSKIL